MAAITPELADRYAAADGGGQLDDVAVAHLTALKARASLDARRIWLLLPRTGRAYTKYITMARSTLAAVDGALPVPDAVSVISSMLSCGYHLRSWASLATAAPGAWSMLTTSLTEVRSRPAVPVWSGDAVVLAGRWTQAQAASAVELMALSALAGERPPVLVIPVVTSRRRGTGSASGQMPLVRAVADTLVLGKGMRGSVTVTTDVTDIGPDDGVVLDEVRAAAVAVKAQATSRDVQDVSDIQWDVLRLALPLELRSPRLGLNPDLRRHLLGALWQLRTREFWCNMPSELGDWQMVHRQWVRWETDGTLDALMRLVVPFTAGARPPRGVPSARVAAGDGLVPALGLRLSGMTEIACDRD